MRWTVEQESILFEYGSLGAQHCARIIAQRFRIYRSAEATQRHAYRIGAPMAIHETCPQCGKVSKKLNRKSGLCPTCNTRNLWRQAVQEEQEIIKKMLKGGEEDEATQFEQRRYAAQRQKNSRLKRSCGDSVGLSTEMSNPRSEDTKSFEDDAQKEKCAPAWQA